MADFFLRDQGSVVGLKPNTTNAKDWFDENVQCEGWQVFGGYVYGDRRPMSDLILAIEDQGFTIESP